MRAAVRAALSDAPASTPASEAAFDHRLDAAMAAAPLDECWHRLAPRAPLERARAALRYMLDVPTRQIALVLDEPVAQVEAELERLVLEMSEAEVRGADALRGVRVGSSS